MQWHKNIVIFPYRLQQISNKIDTWHFLYSTISNNSTVFGKTYIWILGHLDHIPLFL